MVKALIVIDVQTKYMDKYDSGLIDRINERIRKAQAEGIAEAGQIRQILAHEGIKPVAQIEADRVLVLCRAAKHQSPHALRGKLRFERLH